MSARIYLKLRENMRRDASADRFFWVVMMIRTVGEFKKRYFPKAYEKERKEKMTPEELGEEFAKETMEKVKKILEG